MPVSYDTLQDEIIGICHAEYHYPDGWLRHEACPCCGSTRLRPAFAKFGLTHDVCRPCRFVFLNPYPTDEMLAVLYNSAFMRAEREYLEIPKAQADRADASNSMPAENYARLLSRVGIRRQAGTWLDIGGGLGTFLHQARRRFPGFDAYLNEMNRVSAAFARDHYGLTVLSESPDELYAAGRRFDVVSMIAVLEHLTHPRAAVERAISLLNPGGLLVLTVPQFTFLNRWLSHGEAGTVLPPYHVSHFSRRNLVQMVRGAGPVRVRDVWEDGPPAFFWLHLARITDTHYVRIPTGPIETLESIRQRDYTLAECINIRRATYYDRKSSLRRLIEKYDGRIYLHLVAQRAD